jgi:hypothetical protein
MVKVIPGARGMKRSLAGTAVLVCAGFVLGSCQLVGVLLSSTFPASATQVTARRSLYSLIPAAEASSFSMSDVTAGGREYVILSSPLTSAGTRLIIMDTGLDTVLTMTAQDLAGFGGILDSAPAKLDAMGRILVGNVFFSTSASGLVFPPSIFSVPTGTGFQSPVAGNYNFIMFSASGNNFTYYEYYDTWLPYLPVNVWTFPIRALPAGNTSFSVSGIFSDPDPARQVALFVLYDSGDSLDHYFVIPLAALTGGSLSFPLQNFYEVFTKPSTDPALLGYCNGGFIRFVPGGIPGTGAFVRCDLGGNDQPTQLPYSRSPAMRQAFSPSGGSYFSFDLDSRVVTRSTAWWN